MQFAEKGGFSLLIGLTDFLLHIRRHGYWQALLLKKYMRAQSYLLDQGQAVGNGQAGTGRQ